MLWKENEICLNNGRRGFSNLNGPHCWFEMLLRLELDSVPPNHYVGISKVYSRSKAHPDLTGIRWLNLSFLAVIFGSRSADDRKATTGPKPKLVNPLRKADETGSKTNHTVGLIDKVLSRSRVARLDD